MPDGVVTDTEMNFWTQPGRTEGRSDEVFFCGKINCVQVKSGWERKGVMVKGLDKGSLKGNEGALLPGLAVTLHKFKNDSN